jgi:hypothetical protein
MFQNTDSYLDEQTNNQMAIRKYFPLFHQKVLSNEPEFNSLSDNNFFERN